MRFFLFLGLLMLTAACSTPTATAPAAPPAPSFAGTWAVTVEDTPVGTVNGDLNLAEGPDGTLSGTFVSDGTTFQLKSATKTDDGMTVSFYYPDYSTDVDIKLAGKAGDAMLMGQTMDQFRTTAKRKQR